RKKLYEPASYNFIKDWYPNAQADARASNILNAAKLTQGVINVYKAQARKTLAQAEHELQSAYAYALQSEAAIEVLKFPTAIGKTQLILPTQNSIIAVPTHRLKNEVAERMKAEGHDVITSPELPDDIDEVTANYIDNLYAKGAQREVNVYLRDIARINP